MKYIVARIIVIDVAEPANLEWTLEGAIVELGANLNLNNRSDLTRLLQYITLSLKIVLLRRRHRWSPK